ncbi:MAG: M28 family peptidase [Treponemataceae bacterium]|nr:MAG: M28 family peptidase [Treponemataceae bacterium]
MTDFLRFDDFQFDDFLSPECDRAHFIGRYLAEHGIQTSLMQTDSHNHLCVQFAQNCYDPHFRTKTVIVHYDRFVGMDGKICPGANDNSAAVVQALFLAVRLRKLKKPHNIRIIFTDGEESVSLKEQGSFQLAQKFKELKTANDVFVIDCSGRGGTLILAKSHLTENAPPYLQKSFARLVRHVTEIFHTLNMNVDGCQFTEREIPHSDDAGFIASGIPAVVITMLPKNELDCELPQTWQLIHTQNDTADTLTPESFKIMKNFLDALAERQYRL